VSNARDKRHIFGLFFIEDVQQGRREMCDSFHASTFLLLIFYETNQLKQAVDFQRTFGADENFTVCHTRYRERCVVRE
jgi:hypothetical protein